MVSESNRMLLDPEALAQELAEIEFEALGWLPLAGGAYLHSGEADDNDCVVNVVGCLDAALPGGNLLLLIG